MTVQGRAAAAAALAFAVMATVVQPASATALDVAVAGGNGVVRTTEPGLTCADDGEGSYRHYFTDAALGPETFSKLAGKARTTLDVHHDGAKALPARPPNAFLLGTESHVTLSNERGTVQVPLRAGSCAAPAIAFDGATGSGTGAWTLGPEAGTGAYRGVTGSGTFAFTAEMSPGADNPWNLSLNGNIEVLKPGLTVRVERTYWGNLGLDYVTRVVTVVYRIANTGPGDSFGARFKSAEPKATANPNRVDACGSPPTALVSCPNGDPPEQPLGDLSSCAPSADGSTPATCDSELVSVRYRIPPTVGAPCQVVILGCTFTAGVVVDLPDALDQLATHTREVTVTAPVLPPPL